MSGYTLISCIGTGLLKDGKYEKTLYQFPDGNHEAAFFMGALLKSKQYAPIREIVIVGTYTSHWHLVIDDLLENVPAEEYKELREQISTQCKSMEGVSEELLDSLSSILSGKLGISVSIIAHTSEIDEKTVPDIFTSYSSIISEIDTDTDILLDITHGFRSMPLLIYQALQFGFAGQPRRTVNLIYGDLKRERPSIARDLSEYWRLSAFAEAKNLFINRFDGKLLAKLIEGEWAEGNILISRFSTLVECNFSLEIPQWIKDAKEALSRPSKGNESSPVLELRETIQNIISEIDHPYTSDTLLAYSRLLEKKGLYVQSIITLQTAIETRTIEAYGTPGEIGYYDAWKKYEKNKYFEKIYKLGIYSKMIDIRDMRNKIAHGGTKDHDNKGKGVAPHPKASTIRRIITDSTVSVNRYFESVTPGFGMEL